MMRRFLLLQFAVCTCASLCLHAQSTDSLVRRDAYNQAVSGYFHTVAENAMLNQGNEVLDYTIPSQMHPYFLTDQFTVGDVTANGVNYAGAYLLYDLVHDKLIVRHYNNILPVEQVSERIESFSFQGHQFERVVSDSASQSVINTGFYEVLYKGKPISVYARRIKSPEEQIKDMQVNLVFNEKNRYYMKKNDSWYSVSDKKSALKLMADKKKEVEDFLRKNKIKFRKQPEQAFTQMVAYYDSIKN